MVSPVTQLLPATDGVRGVSEAVRPDGGARWEKLPAAFRLTCACSQWPPGPARDDTVRDAAAGVDWDAFLRVAVRQRVLGLAQAALRSASVAPPAPVAARLDHAARLAQRRSLGLAAESIRLQALFGAAGVASLVIKGAPLAQLAYAAQVLKQGRDIDLVVDLADAESGLRLLLGQGYRVLHPDCELTPARLALLLRCHKDLEFYHPDRGLNVELHWRLIDNPALLRNLGAGSPSQSVDVLGTPIVTLADRELFAYLCVHGASHCWFRLKWLADLNAWLTSKSGAELEAFYRFAEAEGVGDCAAEALVLCRRLLGLRLPASLEPGLRGLKVRMLVCGALDAMAGGGAELELPQRPFGPFRLLPAQFLRGRGPSFLLAQVRLVTQSLDDMLSVPLPRPLHFLYPLLRLPLWLARVVRRHRGAAAPTARPATSATGQGQG